MNSQELKAYKDGYSRIDWSVPIPSVPEREYTPPARGNFPVPMFISDSIDPVQSMADGKWYDSKQALHRTYRADGNPQGVEYTVVGDHKAKKGHTPSTIKSKAERQKERIDSIHRAEAKIARGEGVKLPD